MHRIYSECIYIIYTHYIHNLNNPIHTEYIYYIHITNTPTAHNHNISHTYRTTSRGMNYRLMTPVSEYKFEGFPLSVDQCALWWRRRKLAATNHN